MNSCIDAISFTWITIDLEKIDLIVLNLCKYHTIILIISQFF